MTEWPTHPDGRNKKMGEMTKEQRAALTRDAVATIKAEFEDPRLRAAIQAVFAKEEKEQGK